MKSNRPVHALGCAAIAAACAGHGSVARAADGWQALPMAVTLGAERVRMGEGERMGLAGGSVLFEAHPGWWLGPGVYGAASGSRGGLFVGGAELQRRWALTRGLQLRAGLFAGGGGGASAPVGDGLMLRPALTLAHGLGDWDLGLSWSQVRFAGTELHSSQLGLVLGWQGAFRHAPLARVGEPIDGAARSGLGVDRLLVTAGRMTPRGGHGISLVGTRAEQLRGGWRWAVEAAGAAGGGAAGYMEVLASLGHAWEPVAGLELGLRGALGLGGGGNLGTGGGGLARAAAGASWLLAPGWHVGAEWSATRAVDGALRARGALLWVAMDLEPRRDGTPAASTPVARYAWSATLQRVSHAQRRVGPARALDTVGLKIDRHLTDTMYLTAQAHSAFGGGAGAYSVGLVGAGAAWPLGGHGWRAGAELLAGAGGGGGVASGGGGLVQGLGWLAMPAGEASHLRLGLGQFRSRRGSLSSPVLELSWQRAFGLAGP